MLERISLHARKRPDAPAIRSDSVAFTYSQLEEALRKLVVVFGDTVKRGDLVAVGCDDGIHQLLLLLALDYLGVATLSFVIPLEYGIEPALTRCSAIFTNGSSPHFPSERVHKIDREWMNAVMRSAAPSALPEVEHVDSDAHFLIATSGSTGLSKFIMLPRGNVRRREEGRIKRYGIDQDTVYLATMALSVSLAYSTVLGCLTSGATVIIERDLSHVGALLGQATLLVALPLHVRYFLDAVPEGAVARDNLLLVSAGAPLPDDVRARVEASLAQTVFDEYGANEVGMIGRIGAEPDSYTLFPGVEAQAVDDNHRPLPRGSEGLLRIRSHTMVSEYWGPTQAGASFEDGWFYPGDVAVINPSGTLKLLGRADAMLNIGGAKVSAELLERTIVAKGLAKEACVTSYPAASGFEDLYFLLVGALADNSALMAGVATFLTNRLGAVHLLRVNHIPRNANGKVLRAEARRFAGQIANQSALDGQAGQT